MAPRVAARRAWLIAGYVGFLGLGFWASTVLHELSADFEAGPLARGMFGVAFAAYVCFSAIPFMPGAEIGLGLLVTLGAQGALLVYVGMIMAMGIAFCAGRFVPPAWIAGAFGFLGLVRARNLVLTSSELTYVERTRFLETHAPTRWVPFLLRHRYVALGLLLNMPGNVILGGGIIKDGGPILGSLKQNASHITIFLLEISIQDWLSIQSNSHLAPSRLLSVVLLLRCRTLPERKQAALHPKIVFRHYG